MNKNNLKRFNNFLDKLIQGKLHLKEVNSFEEIENKLGKNLKIFLKIKTIIFKMKY